MIKEFLLVGLGGAVGSIIRYSITLLTAAGSIPATIGTLTANVLGSILIGVVIGSCEKGSLYLFAAIGLCGGFTTFSTFSSQSLALMQSGKTYTALLYIFMSVTLCIVATWVGIKIVR